MPGAAIRPGQESRPRGGGRWKEIQSTTLLSFSLIYGLLKSGRRCVRPAADDDRIIYSGVNTYGEFVGRNYEEAMRLAREGIRQRFDFAGAYRVLTAAAAMAGEIDLGRAALQELRRAQPNISLAWIDSHMLIAREAEREHYLEAFRRAGLE